MKRVLIVAAVVLLFLPGAQSKIDPRPTVTKPIYEQGLHVHYGMKQRLTPHQRLQILENELLDPHRNLAFDTELREEIERARAVETKLLMAVCGCN